MYKHKLLNDLKDIFSKNKEIAAVILIVLITAAFYFPVIKDISKTVISENDWWRNYYYAGLSRKTLMQYHQIPLRTPFLGGGYPFIGHPSDFSLSPLFIFILIFGEITGLRIMVFFIFIISAAGMFYLTRNVLKYTLLGGIYSSLTFVLCSWGAYEVVDGNLEKVFYFFFPWLWAFFLKAGENRKFLIFSVCISSLILLNSGVSLIPLFGALTVFSVLSMFKKSKRVKLKIDNSYLIILTQIILITCLVCAAKILPFIELYSMKISGIHSQYGDSYAKLALAIKSFGSCLNLDMFGKSLFDSEFRGYSSMYLGYIPILLSILALLLYPANILVYVVLLILFILIQFGPNSPVDLFKVLWHMRIFGHTMWRLNKYFGFFIPFFMVLIGGKFFCLFRGKRIFAQALAILIIIVSSFNMYKHNRLIFNDMVYMKMVKFKKYDDFYQAWIKKIQIKRKWADIIEVKDIRSYQPFWILLQQNIGVVNFNWKGGIEIGEHAIARYIFESLEQKGECVYIKGYEDTLPQDRMDLVALATVNPAYKGEVFFLNQQNKLKLKYFSPNRIDIEVNVNSLDELVLNQNYHKSWQVNSGIISNYNGLLAVKLTKLGIYNLRLTYLPVSFFSGLAISLITVIGIIGYLKYLTKRENAAEKAG